MYLWALQKQLRGAVGEGLDAGGVICTPQGATPEVQMDHVMDTVLGAWMPQQFLHELYFQPHPGASYRVHHCSHKSASFCVWIPTVPALPWMVPPSVLFSWCSSSAATKTALLYGHVPKKQNLINTEQKLSNGKETNSWNKEEIQCSHSSP